MDIEYLAGFFDAEGSIGINTKSGRLFINATQTDLLALPEFQREWGGTIRSRSLPSGKISYAWNVSRQQDQIQFLDEIIPSLILKRKTARLARAFSLLRQEYIELNGTVRDDFFKDFTAKAIRLVKESRNGYVYANSRLKNATIDYFAGMFDGDGCLGLYGNRNGKVPILRCQFDQCDFPITEEFQRRWNGNLCQQKCNSSTGKIIYKWATTGKNSVKFITDMLPYFVEKKKFAKEILDEHNRIKESLTKEVVLVDPEDKPHFIRSTPGGSEITEFCKKHGLSYSDFSHVVSGQVKHHRSGWRLPSTEREYYFVVDPLNGAVHQIRKYHGCCRDFLASMNIPNSSLGHNKLLALVTGRVQRAKEKEVGWWRLFDLDGMVASLNKKLIQEREKLKLKYAGTSIIDLNLSARTRNRLLAAEIRTVEQLAVMTTNELSGVPQLGNAGIQEIELTLEKYISN